MLNKKGLLFVISGPSGSGKTTLAKRLIKDKAKQLKIEKSISFCTRKPRPDETNKKDYLFITKNEFFQKRKNSEFVEWTKYLGTFYGTSKKYLDCKLKKDKNIVLCLDVNGASALKKLYPQKTVTIFILPPSRRELEKRMKNRGQMCGDEFKARMQLAQKEKQYAHGYDYVLVNDDLNKTLQQLFEIIKKNLRGK